MNIEPTRVIEKYRAQLMAANERNAVLEAAVDQLTEEKAELLDQIGREAVAAEEEGRDNRVAQMETAKPKIVLHSGKDNSPKEN